MHSYLQLLLWLPTRTLPVFGSRIIQRPSHSTLPDTFRDIHTTSSQQESCTTLSYIIQESDSDSMPAAVTAAQAMPQPRSPLKRSATTPLFARSSASNNVPAEPSSDLSTSQDSNNPQTQTGADRQYVSSLPPAGLQAMQHALCRLSSQHQ